MNDEVTKILLNDMPVAEFIAYYLASLLGAFIWFLIKTLKGISQDKSTPKKFQWKYFWRGAIKFLISVLVLPWAIIYFTDYGPFLMEMLFTFPGSESAAGHNHISMELNAGSAFVIGFLIDALIRKATHTTFKKLMP